MTPIRERDNGMTLRFPAYHASDRKDVTQDIPEGKTGSKESANQRWLELSAMPRTPERWTIVQRLNTLLLVLILDVGQATWTAEDESEIRNLFKGGCSTLTPSNPY